MKTYDSAIQSMNLSTHLLAHPPTATSVVATSSANTRDPNDDVSFKRLLHTQRELLLRMNQQQVALNDSMRNAGGNIALFNKKAFESTPLIRRPSLDVILSRRLSIGMGFDGHNLNLLQVAHDADFDDSIVNTASVCSFNKLKLDNEFGICEGLSSTRQTQPLSSMSMASQFRFEECGNASKPTKCQAAILDITGCEHVEPMTSSKCQQNDEDAYEDEIIEKIIVNGDIDSDECMDSIKLINPEAIETLHTAMERSRRSEQALQNWDWKMGLKRSHSVTMCQSSKSRKVLETIFQQEPH
jgi:hypothetical protein